MQSIARYLLLVLWLAGVIGVAVTGNVLYLRIVYLTLITLIVAWAWTYISLHGIEIKRRTRSLRAGMGDMLNENFDLSNNSMLPHLWLTVTNESPIPSVSGSRLITRIGSREERVYTARTRLLQRGAFLLGPTTITSGDPLGLFSVKHEFPANQSLLVLPYIFPIAEFSAHAGYLPGGKAIQRKSFDITPHASTVREYQTGDSVKRIHWASTARRNRLMVKEFEQDPQAQIWLFLDAHHWAQASLPYTPPPQLDISWSFAKRPDITLQPATFEHAVSIAASLAHYFIAQKRAVGLACAGPVYTVINAERSERQESKMLETLAFVQGVGDLAIEELVSAHVSQIPFGSTAILITSTTSPDLLLAVDDLIRRNLHPQVILIDSESFGGLTGTNALVEKLNQRSVPVCKISNGDKLADKLSVFAQQNQFREYRSWQRQPSIPSI